MARLKKMAQLLSQSLMLRVMQGLKEKNPSSSAWRRNFKQEERIGTLKRPRHALEEEIEEAERKKNGKK
jgi:hypothetical protein